MIPRASIIAWSATAPWPSEDQVEQDLILSRLLVEIASDPLLSEQLAFRGGTCLHKLHLKEPQRYSEDLDFVRTDQRPILGEVFDRLRAITERIGLREHRRTFPSKDSDTATMWFDADAESGATAIRVKIETNVAESTPHSDHFIIPFEVTSPWWSGDADVRTFTIEEILRHLKTKLADPDFAADLNGLVRSLPPNYDIADALDLVRRRIGLALRNVPDDPMPIGHSEA